MFSPGIKHPEMLARLAGEAGHPWENVSDERAKRCRSHAFLVGS